MPSTAPPSIHRGLAKSIESPSTTTTSSSSSSSSSSSPSSPSLRMDILTTRKHPTPSQRLLQNLLNTEKSHGDALLQSLALSRNANAAMNAYASSGRDHPLGLAMSGVIGVLTEEGEAKQEAYASTLVSTRLALKEIRDAEEVLANITRDRDILVARMIKQTKKKPSKSELRKSASASGEGSSSLFGRRGSNDMPTSPSSPSIASSSVASNTTAGKMEEAQAELAGCENSLRREEAAVEDVRRRVLRDITEDRLRAMAAMGKSVEAAAQRALVELHTYLSEGAPYDGFRDIPRLSENRRYTPSVDSNTPSLAPSQSASQVARSEYDDSSDDDRSPTSAARHNPHRTSIVGGSSVRGRGLASVIESGSSDEEPPRNVQVVENTRPGASVTPVASPANGHHRKASSDIGARQRTVSAPSDASVLRRLASPNLGLFPPPAPSANWNKRRSTPDGNNHDNGSSSDSSSDSGTLRGAAGAKGKKKKASSDLGVANSSSRGGSFGRHQSLARRASVSSFGGSDSGSIRKKKGFFGSIKSFFIGTPSMSKGGRPGSPDSIDQRPAVSWSTRTDKNLRRSEVVGGGSNVGTSSKKKKGGRGASTADSSDDDKPTKGGLVAVTNLSRQPTKKKAAGTEPQSGWRVETVGVAPSSRPGVKRSSSSSATLKASEKIAPVVTSTAPKLTTKRSSAASSTVGSKTVSKSASASTIVPPSSSNKLGTNAAPVVVKNPPGVAAPKRGSTISSKASTPKTAPVNPKLSSSPGLFEIKAPRSSNPSAGLFSISAPGSSIVAPTPGVLSVPLVSSSSSASKPATSAVNGIKRSASTATARSNTTVTSKQPASSPSSTPKKAPAPVSSVGSDASRNNPSHRTNAAPTRSALKQPRPSPHSSAVSPAAVLIPIKAPPPMVAPAPPETDAESVYETGIEDNDDLQDAAGDDSDDDGYATDRATPRPTASVVAQAPPPAGAILGPPLVNGATEEGATLSRRKSVRMDVPDSPAAETTDPLTSSRNGSSNKPLPSSTPTAPSTTPEYSPSYDPGSWSTRIGRSFTADSSDDEDEGAYASARRAMARAEHRADRKGARVDYKGKGRAY